MECDTPDTEPELQHVTDFCSSPSFTVDPDRGGHRIRIAWNARAVLLENVIGVTESIDAVVYELVHAWHQLWCGTGDGPPPAPPHGGYS